MADDVEPKYKTRVLTPHTDTTDTDWGDYHEPIFIDGEHIWRDARGYDRPGYHRWQVWTCNNTRCEFRALVKSEAIEQIVREWLDG